MPEIINPVPGTTRKNNGGYDSDTGLDILVPFGSPVVAAADGEIIYSERGHTPWVNPPDTPFSILIRLKKPFKYEGVTYYAIWYTHLSELKRLVKDGAKPVQIKQGAVIGKTGCGNRVPHLHFGIVKNRQQTAFLGHQEIAKIIWG